MLGLLDFPNWMAKLIQALFVIKQWCLAQFQSGCTVGYSLSSVVENKTSATLSQQHMPVTDQLIHLIGWGGHHKGGGHLLLSDKVVLSKLLCIFFKRPRPWAREITGLWCHKSWLDSKRNLCCRTDSDYLDSWIFSALAISEKPILHLIC